MVWQSDIFLKRVYLFLLLLWKIFFTRKVTISVCRSIWSLQRFARMVAGISKQPETIGLNAMILFLPNFNGIVSLKPHKWDLHPTHGMCRCSDTIFSAILIQWCSPEQLHLFKNIIVQAAHSHLAVLLSLTEEWLSFFRADLIMWINQLYSCAWRNDCDNAGRRKRVEHQLANVAV